MLRISGLHNMEEGRHEILKKKFGSPKKFSFADAQGLRRDGVLCTPAARKSKMSIKNTIEIVFSLLRTSKCPPAARWAFWSPF